MRKYPKISAVFSFLMVVLISGIGIFLPLQIQADAAEYEKIEKSYDIAVVFDNSGSMYENRGWCRAKYSMEIFASMLNYEKDTLNIFPMWEVKTDGSESSEGGSFDPISITCKEDIDKITNLYTVNPNNTPFEPIKDAYAHLKSSSADEKWLVVLTDGAFNEDDRGNGAMIDLQERFSELASDRINIQYVGFGNASVLDSDEDNHFFSIKSTDTSLKDDLIGICNSIFQRSVLPADRLNGNTLNLDLSMKHVIVFAQGENASVRSLKDSAGNEIPVSLDSGQRRFSTIKANGYPSAPADETLAGQVVTFEASPAGQYTLDYSGTDAVQIFYEPDVDIDITFTNSDGIEVSPEELTADTYTVKSCIVDSSTREDVTGHELMGNDVKLRTMVKTSADEDYRAYENGASIELKPDADTDIYVIGEYLGKYKINSKDDPEWAFLSHMNIGIPSSELAITLAQDEEWYKIRNHGEWLPVKVSVFMNGEKVPADKFDEISFSAAAENLSLRCEMLPEESAYNVYISQDKDGNFITPEKGKYKINYSASYKNDFGTYEAAEENSFEIQNYSRFLRWLFWILLILILIIIIVSILNIHVMPSAVYMKIKTTCNPVKVNGTSVALSTDLYPGEIGCEAKPSTPLRNKGKTTAGFIVKRIRPAGSVLWYELDGTRYTKERNGKYVSSDGETIENAKQLVSDDTELKWHTNRHTVTGRIFINHND